MIWFGDLLVLLLKLRVLVGLALAGLVGGFLLASALLYADPLSTVSGMVL